MSPFSGPAQYVTISGVLFWAFRGKGVESVISPMQDKETNNESVSAVIPVYNGAGFIHRALDSVLAQTHPVEQIIVVDDGSTDKTASAVSEYGGRVEYIYQPNAGAAAARNTGIRAVRGDWVAFLDSDDEWLPDRLARQFELVCKYPELAWISGNFLRSSQGESGAHADPARAARWWGETDTPRRFFEAFAQDLWGCTDTMLIRRSVFDEVGLFSEDLRRANDIDMWFRIAYRHPQIAYVAEPLAVYHLDTAGSIVKTSTRAPVLAKFIERHLELSQQAGAFNEFCPVARRLLRQWIRGMLFAGQGQDARQLLGGFKSLLPLHYRLGMGLATRFPRTTAGALRLGGKGARRVGLGRKVDRPRN